jgi:molybdopterin-guanine dinucleotide biosynthesis protein A
MLGVILCGGKSSRMGSDKGLLKLHAGTWAQTAVEKLMALQIPVVLSVNPNQYRDYSPIFTLEQLVKDDEKLDVHGPLCGVLSVHLKYPQEDLLVLACDMPLMENAVLSQLLETYQQNLSYDAFLFTNEGEPEPLCAIYRANGLTQIMQMLQAGQLTKHSMKFTIEHVDSLSIPLLDEQKRYFRNFNAHAELNGL